MEHIQPYEGHEPYIFISYAHANSRAVLEGTGVNLSILEEST